MTALASRDLSAGTLASRDLQAAAPAPTVLEARGITKRFGAVLANDDVDFDVRAGEIHALLGENGAGKSTLVKILYGFQTADSGQILLDGRALEIRTPADARAAGIGMVFQQFTVIPAFTVAEDVALFLPDLSRVLRLPEIAARISALSSRYGLAVDPARRVGHLSVGERQRVELVRLLLAKARILIFDEPTSVLAEHEVESLFEVFAQLRADGYPVVFITHKLPEVLSCADRITVMRHGRVTATVEARESTEERLVSLMFGAAEAEHHPRAKHAVGRAPVLELRGIATSPKTGLPLTEIDLDVRPGEIVGVAGVSGNGQRELGDVILGMTRPIRGAKRLFGDDASRWSVRRTRERGVAFIPEDPMSMAVVASMTVEENMAIAASRRYGRYGGLAVGWKEVRADIDASTERLGLGLPSPRTIVRTLSGGNVQRFEVARELACDPKLIIAIYPTRGLDVPTTRAVQQLLERARDEGAGILLISQDLNELLALADRFLVLYGGRIVGWARPESADPYEIGRLMTGALPAASRPGAFLAAATGGVS